MTPILTNTRDAHFERHGRLGRTVASDLPAIIVTFTDDIMITNLLEKVDHQQQASDIKRESSIPY